MNITPIEDISEEVERMQDFFDIQPPTELEAMREWGAKASAYLSRIGALQSMAKYWLDLAGGNATREMLADIKQSGVKLTISAQSKVISEKVAILELLHNRLSNLFKVCDSQMGWCRTQITVLRIDRDNTKSIT